MHEYRHAERIAKGLVVDRETEEIDAVQYINRNMRNEGNRREDYQGIPIPKEGEQ